MALTQMQIIQSLGEAMNWFQREIGWGVKPAELPHLCGRIGELFVALITNGRMAQGVNTKGYDVVSQEGERISVKTTTMNYRSGHISFNPNTLAVVDRIIVLFINVEEMQIEILFDGKKEEALSLMKINDDVSPSSLSLSKLHSKRLTKPSKIETVESVQYKNFRIEELETGTIVLYENDLPAIPVKPALHRIAAELSVSGLNSNGNAMNTRQLGSTLIKILKERND